MRYRSKRYCGAENGYDLGATFTSILGIRCPADARFKGGTNSSNGGETGAGTSNPYVCLDGERRLNES